MKFGVITLSGVIALTVIQDTFKRAGAITSCIVSWLSLSQTQTHVLCQYYWVQLYNSLERYKTVITNVADYVLGLWKISCLALVINTLLYYK